MTITTSADIIGASQDNDLIDRIAAIAAQEGVQNEGAFARGQIRSIVSRKVTDSGDTLASVHAYAVASHKPTPAPGADPSKVTDEMIRTAVRAEKGAQR